MTCAIAPIFQVHIYMYNSRYIQKIYACSYMFPITMSGAGIQGNDRYVKSQVRWTPDVLMYLSTIYILMYVLIYTFLCMYLSPYITHFSCKYNTYARYLYEGRQVQVGTSNQYRYQYISSKYLTRLYGNTTCVGRYQPSLPRVGSKVHKKCCVPTYLHTNYKVDFLCIIGRYM